MKYVFLIASPTKVESNSSSENEIISRITAENQRYNDIIMTNYPEKYYQLTYKILAGYNWAFRY
jgi:hypothetical protein